MNLADWGRMKEVFMAALEKPTSERPTFLEAACGSNEALRGRLEDMLAAHAREDTLLALGELEDDECLVRGERRVAMEGARIGNYRVVRVIAGGGMGVVYEAEQDDPSRRVALKVLRAEDARPDSVRRFEREAAILGQLQHPQIAHIHEAGVHVGPDGARLPWFSMELIDGRPLDVFASEERLELRDRLVLFAKLCDALEAAHGLGIVHRDLKPSNILVERSGDPKVLDFGVARLTGGDAQRTLETGVGQLIGTVPYMSPEQAAGASRELDARSDVYSLGVLLYQLLADRMPYDLRGHSIPDALRIIQEDEPDHLSSTDRRFGGDVETIAAKALEKEPARRYPSAGALAADVRRFLADEPIVARPATTFYQLRKFARRHKAMVAGLAAVLVTLVLGLVGTGLALAEAELEARNAWGISRILLGLIAAGDPLDHFSEHYSPSTRSGERTVVELLDSAVQLLDDGLAERPEVEAELREQIGRAYLGHGRLADSELQLRKALQLYRRVSGIEAQLGAMEPLSWALCWQDRHEETEELSVEMLALATTLFGPDDRRTLALRCTVSMNRSMVGSDAELLEFSSETLERAEVALPVDDPIRINALLREAIVLARTEDSATGQQRAAAALAACEEHLHPMHFLRSAATFFTANFLPDAQVDRKAQLLRQAYEGYVHHFGAQNFVTVVAKGRVPEGIWLRREGWTDAERDAAWKQAVAAYEEVIAEADALLGPCHSQTTVIVGQYARLLTTMDGYGHEALALVEERMNCLQVEGHPLRKARLLFLLRNITSRLLDPDASVLERAEELAQRMLEECSELPDLDKPMAELGRLRAEFLTRLGRVGEVEPTLVQALERAERLDPPDTLLVERLEARLAECR